MEEHSTLKWYRKVLPYILVLLTRKPREVPIVQWSDRCYTHNFFRFLELVFGRKVGIRVEAAAWTDRGHSYYKFFTLEAAVAHFEGILRREFAFKPVRVYIPAFSMAGGLGLRSPYLFAIAYDNGSGVYQGSTVSSQNLALTIAGTNRVAVCQTRTYDGAGVSGVTYNSVAMANVGSEQTLGSDKMNAWILHAPATGANNFTATISPNRRIEMYALSVTGANQASVADAVQWTTGTGTSSSGSITTVTDNAWSIAFVEANGASGTPASGTNCTAVGAIADRGAGGYGGPKTPAGSFTQAMTWSGSGQWSFYQVAVAPAAAASPDRLLTLQVT